MQVRVVLVVLFIAQMGDRVPCGGGRNADGLGYVDKANIHRDTQWQW